MNIQPIEEQEKRRLSKIEKRQEKRDRIANEILETERKYVLYMETLYNVFMKPLEESYKSRSLLQPALLSEKDIQIIFGNLSDLINLNRTLLNELENRIGNGNWHENQLVGDVFVRMAPFFKIYKLYNFGYDNAVNRLSTCQKEVSSFQKFLQVKFLNYFEEYSNLNVKLLQI